MDTPSRLGFTQPSHPSIAAARWRLEDAMQHAPRVPRVPQPPLDYGMQRWRKKPKKVNLLVMRVHGTVHVSPHLS